VMVDKFWFSFFKKAVDSATRVRQSYGFEIKPQDWSQLAGISDKSSHAGIMALFYPELKGDPYSNEPGPRRHDFLAALDDEKYKEFYLHILTRSNLRFPDLHFLMRTTKKEGKIMSTVMTHIGYWLNNTPAVVQERNANKPLLRMALVPALQKRHGKSANQKSIELEHQVLTYVREHMDSLTDKAAEHFLNVLPTSPEQGYNNRFDHSTWKDILILVHTMVGPHFQNEIVARFNRKDPNTIQTKPLKTILHSICDGIGKSPEIAQSSVLGKKTAIQTLHEALRPIITKWALEQYDKALQLSSDDWDAAKLARVRAERTKYAVLQDGEMDVDDSASSHLGDSIDVSPERSSVDASAAIAQSPVRQVASIPARREAGSSERRRASSGLEAQLNNEVHFPSDVGGGHCAADGEPHVAAQGEGPSSERDIRRRQIKSGPDHRVVAVGVDALSRTRLRVPESARNSWRRRPVAQPSVPPEP